MDVVSGGGSLASSFQVPLEVLEMYGAPPPRPPCIHSRAAVVGNPSARQNDCQPCSDER